MDNKEERPPLYPIKTIEKWGNIKCEFLLPACTQCTLLSNTSYPHKRINSSGFGKSQNIDPKSVPFFTFYVIISAHKGKSEYLNRNLDKIAVILVVD